MPLKENTPGGSRYGKTLVGAHYIGGKFVGGPKMLPSRNPAYLDDIVGEFPSGGADEVEAACVAARKAFKKWSATPAPIRGEVIGRFGAALAARKEFLSRLLSREVGKPLREARGDVQEAIDTAHFFQSEGRRLYGQTVPSELRNKELQTFRRPLGVCAMITAGNFPIAVPSWKIIPALLCGNTVVWKPSADSPALSYVFLSAFIEAGLPEGVLNVVFGGGAHGAGTALIEAIDKGMIDKISFTGSTAVGRTIGEVAGRNLQVPSLELGGKNPMIVMDDANLDLALEGAVWAGYGTGGQRCTSLANLILHERIADQFAERLVGRIKNFKIGDPSLHEDITYGPMINERFLKSFLEHEAMARKSPTAKCLCPVARITKENAPANFAGEADKGVYAFPALWDHVKITDELAQEEVFGPTINIIRVGSFDEAMDVANGTHYGLSSAIYTNNPQYRLRFKNEITAGMSSINNSTTGAEAHLPFGGNKWSGNGTRESGIWVLDAYTKWQAVNIDDSGGLQLAQIETESVEGKSAEDLSGLVKG